MATTEEEDLPFKAEYAKTGRASCKMCKSPIEKDSLRLAAMVQSSFFDGRQPNWFHERCFFKKQRPASEGDIANFENVRYEDQKRIKTQIAALGAGAVVAASGKGQKRTKGNAEAEKDITVVKKEDELDGPKVKREKPTLDGLQFAIIGLKSKEEKIKIEIYISHRICFTSRSLSTRSVLQSYRKRITKLFGF